MTARILLIAHAPLAHALRACALHVFADCGDAVLALDVAPHERPEDTLLRGQALLAAHGEAAAPVLVLSDLFGATPCNVAQRLAADWPARVVAGVNLPMLLRAITYRHEPLDALAARAVAGGTQGVMQVASAAPHNQNRRNEHDPDTHHHQQ